METAALHPRPHNTLSPGYEPKRLTQRWEIVQRAFRHLNLNAGEMDEVVNRLDREGHAFQGVGLLIFPKVSALVRVAPADMKDWHELEIAVEVMKGVLKTVQPTFKDSSERKAMSRALHRRTAEMLLKEQETEGDFMLYQFDPGAMYQNMPALEVTRTLSARGVLAHEIAGLNFMLTDPDAFGDDSLALAFGGTMRDYENKYTTVLMRRGGRLIMDATLNTEPHRKICWAFFPTDPTPL